MATLSQKRLGVSECLQELLSLLLVKTAARQGPQGSVLYFLSLLVLLASGLLEDSVDGGKYLVSERLERVNVCKNYSNGSLRAVPRPRA